jgi:LemA protein
MKAFGIFIVVLLVIALLGGGCVYQGYNAAIAKDEQVKNAWAEVDNQLQRRFDLIDNLVNTVKGTATQEQTVFLGIAEARKAYFQAKESGDVNAQAQAAGGVESALSRLLLLRETYPELKSNEAFLKLQDQLEGTENRVSVARMNYNKDAQELNVMVRQFPSSFYSRLAGVKDATYFKVPEAAREAPKVNFQGLERKEPK